MIKMIVNLISKKHDDNDNSYPQIFCLQHSLLMRIVHTHEKDLSNAEGEVVTRKVRISLVKSCSTLFSCSVREMYNIVYHDQRKRLMLKSYIPGIE